MSINQSQCLLDFRKTSTEWGMADMKSSDKLVSYSTNPTELPGQRACLFFILPGHGDHINSILDNLGEENSVEIRVSSVSCHFSSFIFFFWNVLPQIIIICWSSYNISEIIWESHKSGKTRRRAEKCHPLDSIQALKSSAYNSGHLHWPAHDQVYQ